MHFVFYTNSVSAHQLPLARELVAAFGEDNYRYIYTGERQGGGQEVASRERWIVKASECKDLDKLLVEADVLFTGLRELELFEKRLTLGKRTIYYSERWLKPHTLRTFHFPWGMGMVKLPGWVRLLKGSYRRMVRKFAAILESPQFTYLPVGKWAQTDMEFLLKRCAGLSDSSVAELSKRFVPWGYFVEEGERSKEKGASGDGQVKVLWVGRMIDWKRVDTIIRAVGDVSRKVEGENGSKEITLTIVGDGPEKNNLQRLASALRLRPSTSTIDFLPPVPIAEVRKLMREHDVYVLSSDGEEGWGAALNEAMEEGMKVLGTFEAGASSAMLPEEKLFHAGDWRGLARLLAKCHEFERSEIGEWSVKAAARRMLKLADVK